MKHSKPPTRRESAQALEAFAPPGWVAPESVSRAINRKVHVGPRKRDEELLQVSLCTWLDTQPRLLYWATPSNTWVGEMTGAKLGYLARLKRMGVKKGIPDISLFFRSRNGQPTFCWAELKTESGRTSEEQDAFMEACNQRGGFTAVCRSLEDLQELLRVAGY